MICLEISTDPQIKTISRPCCGNFCLRRNISKDTGSTLQLLESACLPLSESFKIFQNISACHCKNLSNYFKIFLIAIVRIFHGKFSICFFATSFTTINLMPVEMLLSLLLLHFQCKAWSKNSLKKLRYEKSKLRSVTWKKIRGMINTDFSILITLDSYVPQEYINTLIQFKSSYN